MARLVVKVTLGDTTRRILLSREALPPSYLDLAALISSRFNLASLAAYELKVLDSDNDWITVSSDEELEELVAGFEQDTNTLRLCLVAAPPTETGSIATSTGSSSSSSSVNTAAELEWTDVVQTASSASSETVDAAPEAHSLAPTPAPVVEATVEEDDFEDPAEPVLPTTQERATLLSSFEFPATPSASSTLFPDDPSPAPSTPLPFSSIPSSFGSFLSTSLARGGTFSSHLSTLLSQPDSALSRLSSLSSFIPAPSSSGEPSLPDLTQALSVLGTNAAQAVREVAEGVRKEAEEVRGEFERFKKECEDEGERFQREVREKIAEVVKSEQEEGKKEEKAKKEEDKEEQKEDEQDPPSPAAVKVEPELAPAPPPRAPLPASQQDDSNDSDSDDEMPPLTAASSFPTAPRPCETAEVEPTGFAGESSEEENDSVRQTGGSEKGYEPTSENDETKTEVIAPLTPKQVETYARLLAKDSSLPLDGSTPKLKEADGMPALLGARYALPASSSPSPAAATAAPAQPHDQQQHKNPLEARLAKLAAKEARRRAREEKKREKEERREARTVRREEKEARRQAREAGKGKGAEKGKEVEKKEKEEVDVGEEKEEGATMPGAFASSSSSTRPAALDLSASASSIVDPPAPVSTSASSSLLPSSIDPSHPILLTTFLLLCRDTLGLPDSNSGVEGAEVRKVLTGIWCDANGRDVERMVERAVEELL
ncbi:hypothetical protein JCM8547_001617 [Rhodosporidiobolus lusitaniae]